MLTTQMILYKMEVKDIINYIWGALLLIVGGFIKWIMSEVKEHDSRIDENQNNIIKLTADTDNDRLYTREALARIEKQQEIILAKLDAISNK